MSERFVNIDRETPMLFPADMRDWLPEDHLVYFIIEAIEPIFGIIKSVMGFRQFMLCGIEKVNTELAIGEGRI